MKNRLTKFIIKWTLTLLSCICGTAVAFSCENNILQTGDLLFEVKGNSDFSDAIAESTTSDDSLQYVHVAIFFYDQDGNSMVLEASPQHGVRKLPLDDFKDQATSVNGRPGVVIKRLTIPFDADEMLARAQRHIGEGYDWWYLPDNGYMYCSELIFESYIDNESNHIFEAKPMNFRSPDGSIPEFWTKLFNELGMPVPEGIVGTNPSDMSKSDKLIEVFRYF